MQNLCNSEGKVIGLIFLLTLILFFDTEENDRMMSVHFQGKPFNIMLIEVYAQLVMLKKLKLNGSMKTYKTF